jgi:hypothetical protein
VRHKQEAPKRKNVKILYYPDPTYRKIKKNKNKKVFYSVVNASGKFRVKRVKIEKSCNKLNHGRKIINLPGSRINAFPHLAPKKKLAGAEVGKFTVFLYFAIN